MALRHAVRSALDNALRRRLPPFRDEDWASSALVVAPHPDDETLGCGGVAAKKIAAGSEVHFAFVTDGAASHTNGVGLDELRVQRRKEALEAVRRLGGSTEQVAFLDVPDGRAADHIDAITRHLTAMLRQLRPESVYLIHRSDPPSDHAAVHEGATAAVRAYGERLTVFEYPVWFWHHWPWVPIRSDLPGMLRMNLKQTARMVAGLRSVCELNVAADISDGLESKRTSLAAHESQMQRPSGQRDWPILDDVGRGDFLLRLTCDYEPFRRYVANA